MTAAGELSAALIAFHELEGFRKIFYLSLVDSHYVSLDEAEFCFLLPELLPEVMPRMPLISMPSKLSS
jgi:hypothetical protein